MFLYLNVRQNTKSSSLPFHIHINYWSLRAGCPLSFVCNTETEKFTTYIMYMDTLHCFYCLFFVNIIKQQKKNVFISYVVSIKLREIKHMLLAVALSQRVHGSFKFRQGVGRRRSSSRNRRRCVRR